MFFSSEFTWNLEFDGLHRCITGVFLPMLRKEKGLSDFFRFFIFTLITLINRSIFRVLQEKTACRIYLEMMKEWKNLTSLLIQFYIHH